MGFNFNFLKDLNKEKEVPGKTFRFLRDTGVAVGRGVARLPANITQSSTEQGTRQANTAVSRSVDQLKSLDYEARKKALQNPGLRQVLSSRGVNVDDPTDENLGIKVTRDTKSYQPKGIAAKVLGPEPVESYQTRREGYKKTLEESRFRDNADALAGLGIGLMLAGDFTGGGKKEAGEALVKQLAKESTEQGVRKVLGKDVAPELATAIANTKDKNVIKNLLSGGKSQITTPPALPSMVPPIPPATSVEGGIQAAGEGSDIIKATIPQVEQPSDPFEEILGAVRGTPNKKGRRGQKGLAAKVAEQEALLRQERGQRFAKSAEAARSAPGSQGYFAEKSALSGSYGKVEFNPLVDDIGPERAEDLFTAARAKILETPDEVYRDMGLHPQAARLNTQTAVRKVLGLEPGLPTRSELRLLGIASPKLAEEAAASIPVGRKIHDAASSLFGNVRSAKSTLDLSMGGRQGLFVAARHPREWGRANLESIKYAKDGQYYKDSMKAIHEDEWGKLIDKYNPNVLTGGSGHEEAYAATDLLTGPVAKDKLKVGNVVAGSERAYTGGLTKLRKDILVKNLRAFGDTAEEVEKNLGTKGINGLLETVNTLTGRGGKAGGFTEKHIKTLGSALFSPRLWASRLAPLNPAFWDRIGPAGRKEAMQSLGSFAALAGVVLGAAVAAGAEVESDPRSSDFLKIKVGDTRYDILGGFQQNLVFGARQGLGFGNKLGITDIDEYKSSTTGKTSRFGEEFGGANQLTSAFDLVRNKSNPILSAGFNILEGEDKAGNKVNPATEIGQLFVPISLQNAWNNRTGGITGIAKGLPELGGIGSQTYGIKDVNLSEKEQKIVDKLKNPEQQEAYTRFLQTAKVASGTRDNVTDKIKEALRNDDLEKAKQLAKDYNKEYAAGFKDWKKQYGKYSDKDLTKEYNSNKITGESIKRMITALKKGEKL